MDPLIVFLDSDSLRADLRAPDFAHRWQSYPSTAPGEVVTRLRDAEIAVVNKVKLDAETLAQLSQLRMVAVAATGTNNVDLDYCKTHGIVVSNIRGYAANTVPEHVFSLMLALRRQLLAYRKSLAEGRWQRATQFCYFDFPIRDLHGATLGLVGRGSIGQGVAKLAEAFGMRVLWAEHKGSASARAGYVPFTDILQQADVISLHCPLTESTRHLFGAAELRAMKREAILINTARGGLVDETVLVQALQEGWIAGAGFDVLTEEPPVRGNPLLDLNLPNFILTPHVGWASDAAMQALADQLIDNIEAFVQGQPKNRVA